MRTEFNHIAFIQHGDAINGFDGTQAMRDDNRRASFHQTIQCFLNESF